MFVLRSSYTYPYWQRTIYLTQPIFLNKNPSADNTLFHLPKVEHKERYIYSASYVQYRMCILHVFCGFVNIYGLSFARFYFGIFCSRISADRSVFNTFNAQLSFVIFTHKIIKFEFIIQNHGSLLTKLNSIDTK